MNQVSPKTAGITVAATALLAVGFLFLRPAHRHEVAPPAKPVAKFQTSVKLLPLVPGKTVTLEMPTALDQEAVSAEFEGNGREKMWVTVRNKDSKSLRLRLAAGQLFESGRNRVVLMRPQTLEVHPGEPVTFEVQTAAISLMNEVGTTTTTTYQLVPEIQVRLRPLLAYLETHPEVSTAAAQTAVLAITENQPVRAFAKFAQLGGNLPSQFQNSAFKVDVVDILAALTALRDIGCPEQELALTVDPQLKIEAMIDPLAHALAMRYYRIKPAEEWSYWKNELLRGEMSTRHYALYGIAHYFPEIAVQMLPAWARESRTNIVFRTSAVQALAETGLPEALPALRQIEYEMGGRTEIGKTARNAADFLAKELNKPAAATGGVAFRSSRMLSKL